MACFKKQFCRLCLGVVTDNSFTIIENFTKDMLDLLLLKLNFENEINIMCGICSVKLFAAFEFKSACLYTNNTIRTYADCENKIQLDIRDIYMKEMEDKQLVDVLNDQKVCRLCMQLVAGEFMSVQDSDSDVLQSYIPEININFTSDPVICKVCYDALHFHAGFLKTCINAQGEIENKFDTKHTAFVKNENVKIEIIDQKDETNVWMETEELLIKSEECSVPKNLAYQPLRDRDESEVQKHKSKECGLASSKLKHRDASEVQMYDCKECDYRTKHKRYLTRHRLKHRDASEVQMYKCNNCDYQTKFKACLAIHMLKHDMSVARMYKCKKCDFESKYRNTLATHQLIHKDFSETQVFKCKDCDYQTKRKTNLTAHELTHKANTSGTRMYKCKECDYRTKYKGALMSHQLRHRDPSEVKMYRCDKCDYETKFRNTLARHHHLVHADASETQLYKCEDCDFRTKYKRNLASHQQRHKDKTATQVYKCDKCDFRIKCEEKYLARHQVWHKKMCVTSVADADTVPSTSQG